MRVGVLVLEIYLHGSSSLKEKRKVVRGLLDRCRTRYNVSAAEVEHQDLHQRSALGFAAVASAEAPLHALFDRILEDAESFAGSGVREESREIL